MVRSSNHFSLFHNGLLKRLSQDYNLSFLNLDSQFSSSIGVNENLASSIFGIQKFSRISTGITGKFFILRFKISNLCYFFNEIMMNQVRLVPEYLIKKTLAVEGTKFIPVAQWLLKFRLLGVIVFILKAILRFRPPRYIASSGHELPDLVLLLYSCFNQTGYIDDIIRECKKSRLKSFGLQMNWDNIPDRYPLEVPNFLGVYGEQAFLCALLYHKIPPYRMYPVGSIAFDKYRAPLPNTILSRATLSLPANAKLVGILPTGEFHDELYLLINLSRALKRGEFSNDVYFYYKDYQYGKVGTIKNLCKLEGRDDFEFLLKDMSDRIIFFEPEQKATLGNDLFYVNLMASLDVVVSTFSTMALEAAFCGKPLLLLDYNPANYGVRNDFFDWTTAQFNVHLYALRNCDAVLMCDSRESLVAGVNKVLGLVGNQDVTEALKSLSKACVYQGVGSAEDRIVDTIQHIMDNNYRDKSFNRYLDFQN